LGDAIAWAASLVVDDLSGWRLPTMNSSSPEEKGVGCGDAAACAAQGSELGYMFFGNLGGTFGSSKTGTQTALGGQVLTGIQDVYWSSTEFSTVGAWNTSFVDGTQTFDFFFPTFRQLSAWAVRPGDIAATPEAASLLLIGAGMLGLAWSRRRKS